MQDSLGVVFGVPDELSPAEAQLLDGIDRLLAGTEVRGQWPIAPQTLMLDAGWIAEAMLPSAGPLPRAHLASTAVGRFHVAGHDLDLGADIRLHIADLIVIDLRDLGRQIGLPQACRPAYVPVHLQADARTLATYRLIDRDAV